MFNFLVTAHEGAWDIPAYEYTRDRFLEYTNDKEKTLFKSLTAEHIDLLKSFPCLFAYEGDRHPARVGYLRSIKERSRSILIEYEFEPEINPIPFEDISTLLRLLDIGEWEMTRTHWAVKDEDLFKRLHDASLIDQKFINPAGRTGKLEELRFKVAFSFPGEVRNKVLEIVNRLKGSLPSGTIFYDDDFTAQLARPNLDNLLQAVYLRNSDLIVIFLSGDYEKKMWCGIEWRAIRGIINNKSDHAVMFVRSDTAEIPGVFSHDGYIDLNRFSTEQVADFIIERVRLNEG
ncbi:TIR domain-containing protein [Chitiniphilus purpureus]|uniref:TIR domain-containing protein n=1 Tax=Chitiniphilus purpureus TaxID=2981137 RepID=A0ABY6DPA1_9NEIS|nr:TIR domain-containing protein [Chitiniphilus sp. CD1]UXY16210.1 TIR domain-containing protein [Chitiniphilus sp. CD1]